MKFGLRKPSLRKSFSARTSGRATRAFKRAVIPGYGKRGMGWFNNPKKALYNKLYRKTTFSLVDLVRKSGGKASGGGCCVALAFFFIVGVVSYLVC